MKLSKIEVILLTISLFGTLIFFGYYTLTGRVYGGAASDNSYISFMMIVDIIPLSLFVKFLFSKGNKKNVAPIIIVLMILTAIYGIGVGVSDINFKSLLAFSSPAAVTGILIAKSNRSWYFVKLLEPVMLFLTVVGIASMRYLLVVRNLQDMGEEGIGISSLSYHCGFAFALNLYFLLFGNEMPERFKYAQTTLYKYVSILLLIVQFAVGLSSGGRGGFVLLLVSGVVMVFLRLAHRRGSSSKTVFTFFLLLMAGFIAVQFMPENIVGAMTTGSERTFSYISKGGGIDTSETSNRDVVYADCIRSIEDSPIIGHGILMRGTPFYGDRPHNIFFEVLLQGGILYLMLFLAFILSLFNKTKRLVRQGHGLFIVPVALYPMVELMFSASYIGTDLFWFVISYILCCEMPRQQRERTLILSGNSQPA